MRAVVPVSVAMDPRAVAALVLVLLVRLAAAHDAEDLLAGCRTAANDLVFILDGSSSLGEPDFSAAKRWLADITAGFDVSQRHTQVAVVQYSDTPRLEVPLGGHQNGADLLDRIANITRLGGSTRTGRAITFALDHVFPSANRTGRSRNRMAVVLTDGRSQDDVVDAAMEAQAQNIALFAVGVGDEISNSELVAMASKPSSAYVLYVQDYPSIGSIHDAMQQRLCEASVCPLRITGSGGDVRGFDLLGLMGVDIVSKKVQGSLSTEGAYLLSPRADLTHNTREIFPEGLPPSYVFVATLRVKSPTNQMKFDLWRVLSLDGVKQVAVTLNGAEKSVIFTTGDSQQMEQYIIFNDRGIKRLFDTSWHQLKLLVKPKRVTCYLDGVRIEEQLLEPAGPIYINGRTQLAKKVNMETTVPIVLQKLRVYCDPLQSERETACEIHSVEDARCPADRAHVVPQACDCPSGKPGVTGLPGPMGFRGEKGREGPPGPDGKPGKPGDNGPPGEPGSKGHKGEAGTAGVKGERGLSGAKGDMGPQGPTGLPGPPAPAWPEYSRLKAEDLTVIGMKGERGDPGEQGQAGEPGPVGEPGIAGGDGPPGAVGPKGERGEVGMAGNDGQAGAPGIRGFPGEPGRMGPQGERGMQGATGIPGPRGPQGVQGPVGQVGPEGGAGPKGNSGLRGQDGLPGPTGPKGSVGEPGVQGLPGDRGPAGFKGHKGDAGDPGPKGNQGEKGIDGRPSAPGVPGLPGARGSRGERGPVGEAGSRGAVGHKGEAGAGGPPGPRGFPGQDGTQGQPGVPGYPGKPGKPPSEEQLMKICAAVLQTELPQLLPMLSSRGCRHCESVQGPPGEPGPPGPKGSGGAPGYPGNAGSQGYPGPPGRRGPQGIKGGVGPMGMKGSKGEGDIGLPGPSGPPGVEGPRGNDGEGYPGPPGPPGKAGSPGAPGTQGPMGPSGVCDPSSCYQPYNIRERHFGKGPPY